MRPRQTKIDYCQLMSVVFWNWVVSQLSNSRTCSSETLSVIEPERHCQLVHSWCLRASSWSLGFMAWEFPIQLQLVFPLCNSFQDPWLFPFRNHMRPHFRTWFPQKKNNKLSSAVLPHRHHWTNMKNTYHRRWVHEAVVCSKTWLEKGCPDLLWLSGLQTTWMFASLR